MAFNDVEFNYLKTMYTSGYSIENIDKYLADSGHTAKDFIDELILREITVNENKMTGKRLSENLKKLIAQRDSNGISRTEIFKELNLNFVTVRRACEKYGSANKYNGRVSYRDIYEVVPFAIKHVSDGIICPICRGRANSTEGSPDIFFCVKCLEEYTIRHKKLYRTRWENID